MACAPTPPIPGDWERREGPGTGAWSLGEIHIDRASSRLCMQVQDRHCNAYGVMHGGAMATLLDAQITAARSYSGTLADHTPTISLSVDYVGPAPEGAWLVVAVDLQKATGSMLFTRAEVSIDGTVVARSSAIYHSRKARNAS